MGISIAGLQEARSARADCVVSDSFIRVCSGKTGSGHLGVEAWFRRGAVAGDALSFEVSDLTVVHWTPRLLCVRVRHKALQALVVVLHAPTTQDPERGFWWCNTRSLLCKLARGGAVLILGDFNVRFNTSLPGHVGSLVWDSNSAVPPDVLLLLQDLKVWLPATFEHCQHGPSSTWQAPGSSCCSRIDYIGVPLEWSVGERCAFVADGLEWGQSSVDHFGVEVHASFWTSSRHQGCSGRKRLDQAAMATPEGQARIRDICNSVPVYPWHMDANEHVECPEDFLYDGLAQAFPLRKQRRQVSFLSDATWMLRGHRLWLRRQTTALRRQIRLGRVSDAFRAWQMDRPFTASSCVGLAWLACQGAQGSCLCGGPSLH